LDQRPRTQRRTAQQNGSLEQTYTGWEWKNHELQLDTWS
jgi:hypothetical protein